VIPYGASGADARATRKRAQELQPFGWQLSVFGRIYKAAGLACERTERNSVKARHAPARIATLRLQSVAGGPIQIFSFSNKLSQNLFLELSLYQPHRPLY
jgi:hypothetical protein